MPIWNTLYGIRVIHSRVHRSPTFEPWATDLTRVSFL